MDSLSTISNTGGPLSLQSAIHAGYNPLSGPTEWYYDTLGHRDYTQPFLASDMVQDPATGLWVNKNTGKIYSDAQGQRPVSNLDLHQLTARSTAISNNLYGQAEQGAQNFAKGVGDQRGFVGSLQDVINGTAPSVAQDQLFTALGKIRAGQLSAAAGATGDNAALANMNAQRNIANASIQAGNDAATLRAQETAAARGQEGQTLGQITTALGDQYGRQLAGAQGASQQSVQSQSKAQDITEQGDEKNKDLAAKAAGGIGGALLGAL